MANICSNDFLITFNKPEIEERLLNKVEKLLNETLDGEIIYSDEGLIEGYFNSRWTFPMHVWEDFFDEFDDPDLYMRCLSTEYGCLYVAMNIYRDNSWEPEQSFDL